MDSESGSKITKAAGGVIVVLLIIAVGLGIYWTDEPDVWDVGAMSARQAELNGETVVNGYTTTSTLIS